MGESLKTQNAYLSTTDFPIVILTECGLLGDLERTRVMERLEELIDQAERHAVIIDLTEAVPLPEKQRIYVAEAVQMRSKAIAEKWTALAIVVSGAEHLRLTKAEFWLSVSPVPARVFADLASAKVWAQERVGAPGSAPVEPTAEPASQAERVSAIGRTTTSPRPIQRTSRAHKAPAPSPVASERVSVREGKAAKAPAASSRNITSKLGRKGWLACAGVLASGLLLLLGPTGTGKLSGAEAREFEQLRSKVALRVLRDDPQPAPDAKKEAQGQAGTPKKPRSFAPGDKVAFMITLPAKGHMMIVGVGADATLLPVFPGAASGLAGRAEGGTRLPFSYALGDTMLKQFSLVYCPMAFEISECHVTRELGVACLSECVVSDFSLSKAPP